MKVQQLILLLSTTVPEWDVVADEGRLIISNAVGTPVGIIAFGTEALESISTLVVEPQIAYQAPSHET